MPSARKVTWAQLRVGVLALAAMAIVAVAVFLLTGTKKLFTKNFLIYTYMADSAALAKGAPVRLNGILAGTVENVTLSGEKNPQRVIKVHMAIEQAMLKEIPVDSIAAISAENVLGTKFLNITKGQSDTLVQPGAEIQ